MNESSWFLAWELHSTYPTLCYKEIRVDRPSKIRVLPSEILLLTPDLENFVTASKHVIINLADVQTVINWTVVDQLLS